MALVKGVYGEDGKYHHSDSCNQNQPDQNIFYNVPCFFHFRVLSFHQCGGAGQPWGGEHRLYGCAGQQPGQKRSAHAAQQQRELRAGNSQHSGAAPSHRLGVYFLETGFGVRSSQVVYDRKHSAFVEYDYSCLDVERLLDGHDWLHLSGITPALGKNCVDLSLTCLKVAKEKGGDREL